MKKNIGNVLALYPTPAVVVGTEISGKVNWLLVAHVGIIGHDRIMLSMFKKHYTNEGVKQTGKVSVNMVSEAMLERADYVGCTSDEIIFKSGYANRGTFFKNFSAKYGCTPKSYREKLNNGLTVE